MIIENYLQSEPDLYNAENYKTLDNKIKNWDGCDFEVFLSSITDNDLYLMLEWLQFDCTFDIDCEYFDTVNFPDYDIAKETIVREYIQRQLMWITSKTISLSIKTTLVLLTIYIVSCVQYLFVQSKKERQQALSLLSFPRAVN